MSSNISTKSSDTLNKLNKHLHVDPIVYKDHIDRVKKASQMVLHGTDQEIGRDKAVVIMQTALMSFGYANSVHDGERIIINLADPCNPGVIRFENIDELIDKISKKITTKSIFDQCRV